MNVERELEKAIFGHPEGGILALADRIHRVYGPAAPVLMVTLVESVRERSGLSEACRLAMDLLAGEYPRYAENVT